MNIHLMQAALDALNVLFPEHACTKITLMNTKTKKIIALVLAAILLLTAVYSLLRFGDTGASTLLANEYVGYYDTDADATAVAQFFEKLNVYLIKIIVIRDPYRLTGRMWLKQDETELGTVPAESASEQPEETQPDAQAPVMGFVQMWLSMSYFVEERHEALGSVVEVAARQVSRLEPDEPLPRLDTDELDEMSERLELIGDTSASTLLMADAEGRVLLAVGVRICGT